MIKQTIGGTQRQRSRNVKTLLRNTFLLVDRIVI
jgi:hypothetical protein